VWIDCFRETNYHTSAPKVTNNIDYDNDVYSISNTVLTVHSIVVTQETIYYVTVCTRVFQNQSILENKWILSYYTLNVDQNFVLL
jgi:hypothetical protein